MIVFADRNRQDTAFGSYSVEFDAEIGKDNDFELVIPVSEYNRNKHVIGGYWYMPGTEYGGQLRDRKVSTSAGTVTFNGPTFRGILSEQYIIENSKRVNGDLSSVIAGLVAIGFSGMFVVDSATTGRTVDLTIPSYSSVLDAIDYVLKKVGYKLQIDIMEDLAFAVVLKVVPIKNLSDELEISQDYGINFVIQNVSDKYTHMLFLGSGEGSARTVKKYSISATGIVSEVSTIPKNTKVYKYDYPNYEEGKDPIEDITKKFGEINKTDNQELTVSDDVILDYGDIVAGRDYITGTYIEAPVTSVVAKYEEGYLRYTYEIGVI